MKCLLISHYRRLCAAFKLDLRNIRQKLGLGVCLRMTVSTDSPDRIGIFLEQLRGQSGRAIRGPGGFVRRMLYSFRSRLGRVVTFNASDRLGPVNAAVLGDVIEVVELNRSQLCIRSQRDYFRRLLSILN
jgi:hypothetical protein